MEAVLEASVMRLRPILMTTGAMVLGAGAEARNDIGWVIVGGMTVGTLFTLFVVPTVYTYLVHRTPRLQRDALATNEPTLATQG